MVLTVPPTPPVVEPEPPVLPARKTSTMGALWRSCLVPGWGQRYKGHSSRGKKILFATGTTLGISAVSITLMEVTHSDYKRVPEGNPGEMDSKYRMYRLWSNAAFFSAISFGVVYFYNIYDAAFTRVREKHSYYDNRIGPELVIGADNIRFGCKLKF